jgi:hypothetical protein
MKAPPIPLPLSGLSEKCPDVIGTTLVVRCCHGWGWTHHSEKGSNPFVENSLAMGELEIIPENYVHFTTSRSGIAGRSLRGPERYSFKKFVAFIMNDGCDFNFTDRIAHAWRIMVGDGGVDYDSEWFPILSGPDSYFGYGVIGLDRSWLDQAGTTWHPMSKQYAGPERSSPPPSDSSTPDRGSDDEEC